METDTKRSQQVLRGQAIFTQADNGEWLIKGYALIEGEEVKHDGVAFSVRNSLTNEAASIFVESGKDVQMLGIVSFIFCALMLIVVYVTGK